MDKNAAIQAAVNASAVVAQVINDYGRDSEQAIDALDAALNTATTARQHGATDNDLRNTHPQ